MNPPDLTTEFLKAEIAVCRKATPDPWFQDGQFDADIACEIYTGMEQRIAEVP